MSDLGWKADGIERAVACGGVALEVYRRPGFTGGRAVRHTDISQHAGGTPVDDPHYFEADIEIVGRKDPTP